LDGLRRCIALLTFTAEIGSISKESIMTGQGEVTDMLKIDLK
jgi:hypothetical protein